MNLRYESVKENHRIVNNGKIMCIDSVQQPPREFKLRVEKRPSSDIFVDIAAACREVRCECVFGCGPRRGHQPVQITGWVIHRQARPTDNANNSVPVNEYRIRREGAVDDGFVEVPEHRIVSGFLPATDERGRNTPGIGGSANELNNRGAGVSGPVLRQARLDHEPGWESVDRGDHLT